MTMTQRVGLTNMVLLAVAGVAFGIWQESRWAGLFAATALYILMPYLP